jgi:hypothetical protein
LEELAMHQSVLLMNIERYFFSSDMAESVARIIIEGRYGAGVFEHGGVAEVRDAGDYWVVSVANGAVDPPSFSPKILKISIAKVDRRVIEIG